MRASKLYSKDFLLNHLYKAATYRKPDGFVIFQVDQINQNTPKFQSDFLTVNIIHLNEKSQLDGDITSAVAHNSQDTINSYQKHLIHDDLTPISFLNPGTAMFNTSVRSIEEWIDQPIYKLHCTPYDHHWVISISYRLPHHKTAFLAFHYMRAKGDKFADDLHEEFIEYITYPFYLGWLHLYGFICAETLHENLSLCAGMTASKFRIIRAIAGQGIANARLLGKKFHVTPKAIEKQIGNIHETLLFEDPELQALEKAGNANRILAISKKLRFFDFGSSKF